MGPWRRKNSGTAGHTITRKRSLNWSSLKSSSINNNRNSRRLSTADSCFREGSRISRHRSPATATWRRRAILVRHRCRASNPRTHWRIRLEIREFIKARWPIGSLRAKSIWARHSRILKEAMARRREEARPMVSCATSRDHRAGMPGPSLRHLFNNKKNRISRRASIAYQFYQAINKAKGHIWIQLAPSRTWWQAMHRRRLTTSKTSRGAKWSFSSSRTIREYSNNRRRSW